MTDREPVASRRSRSWYEARWIRALVSLVLLGVLARSLHFDPQQWLESTRHVIW